VIRIGDGKDVTLSSSVAAAEKYLRGSVNTEVKVITNAPAYELPSTGGTGDILYAAGGLLLIFSSGLLLLYNYIKRRRGDFTSS
jgi:LPXTG-motif cell wall-anchored protein